MFRLAELRQKSGSLLKCPLSTKIPPCLTTTNTWLSGDQPELKRPLHHWQILVSDALNQSWLGIVPLAVTITSELLLHDFGQPPYTSASEL